MDCCCRLDGLLGRAQRFFEPVDQIERVGQLKEQAGVLPAVQRVAIPQHRGQLVDGLAVRTGGDRLSDRARAGPDDELGVSSEGGVMNDPRRACPPLCQEPGDERIPPDAFERGEGVLDGPASQFVPEPDLVGTAVEHSGVLGRAECCLVSIGKLDRKPPLDPAGHHGQPAHGRDGFVGQLGEPGQDGIFDSGRNRIDGRGNHLGDEERIAARDGEQLLGSDRCAGCELSDTDLSQRPERNAYHSRATQQSEDGPQRVRQRKVLLAVGQHEDQGCGPDPPGDVTDGVQRAVVGPMQILEHDDDRPLLLPGENPDGVEDRVRPDAIERRESSGGKSGRNVVQRRHGARRREIVAGSDEHRRLAAQRGRHPVDQRGLADPGFARDADDPARARAGRRKRRRELGQCVVTFDQRVDTDVTDLVEDRRSLLLAAMHGCDHAVATTVDGGNDPLPLAVVSDTPASGLDPAGEGGFTDEAVAPDRVEQLFLGDDPLSVGGQVDEHVEDLWLGPHHVTVAPDFVAVKVDLDIAERQERHPRITPRL